MNSLQIVSEPMSLQKICDEQFGYIKAGIGSVVFVEDDDGDVFYLYTDDIKTDRIAIQSLNKLMNPVIHGNIKYKVVARTHRKMMRQVLIDRFRKQMEKK